MRLMRYLFLCAVLGGLGLAFLDGSKPVSPLVAFPTAYGSNTPTGIGASIYPTQTLLIAGHGGSEGLGAGPIAGIVIGGVLVGALIVGIVVALMNRG